METTQAASNNTELSDRILWYDGDSTIDESYIIKMVTDGVSTVGLFVTELSKDIKQYNTLVKGNNKITIKTDVHLDPIKWIIQKKYAVMDPIEYVTKIIETSHNLDNRVARLERVYQETILYEDMELIEMLRVLIYIINTLQTNSIVWGVGRGSSVSSYILYLIGVHDVDSYAYDLPIEDFLHN